MDNNKNAIAPILYVSVAGVDEPMAELAALLYRHGFEQALIGEEVAGLSARLTQLKPAAILLQSAGIAGEALETCLKMLSREYPQIPVIVLADAVQRTETARYLTLGAFDTVIELEPGERLIAVLQHALALVDLRRENNALRERMLTPGLVHAEAFSQLVTNSENMLALFRYAESVAASGEPLLITGEAGTGKSLLARVVHQVSGRSGGLVPLSVDGLGEQLLQQMLYGDAERAGMLKHAADGFLCIDEVDRLTPAGQQILLQVLQRPAQTRPAGGAAAPARIVSQTRRDLWALVRQQRFRNDLNFHLRCAHLHLPPLRARRGDVPLLVEHFLARQGGAAARLDVPDRLWAMFDDYPFPGNVGELQLIVRTAVGLSRGRQLNLAPIAQHLAQRRAAMTRRDASARTGTAGEGATAAGVESGATLQFPHKLPTLRESADLLLKEALRRANGNQSVAGRMLGISQQAVSKRLKTMSRHESSGA